MKLALDPRVRARLVKHFQAKVDNGPWIARCMEGDTAAFPYRPYQDGRATMGRHLIMPYPPLTATPTACDNVKPRYVINIPFRHYPGEADVEPFTRILNLFLDQAFGMSPEASRAELMQRVVVVIGINQIESIDPVMNREFATFIGALPRIEGVVYRVIGFHWKPEWVRCSEIIKRTCRGFTLNQLVRVRAKPAASRTPLERKLMKKYVKCRARLQGRVRHHFGEVWNVGMIGERRLFGSLYKASKAFLVLKALSTHADDCATPVRSAFEGTATGLRPDVVKQVPYQGIRQVILRSEPTRTGVVRFQETAPGSLGYFFMMDHDLLSFRQGGEGLFSRYDEAIGSSVEPSTISLGYSIEDDKPPLLRAGIRIDMLVRKALGPLGYLPEPCSGVLVRRPNQSHHLGKISFVGGGTALESRRLCQSGRAAGVLLRDGIFPYDGGVTMETPARMLKGSINSVVVLTPQTLKRIKSLMAIRGVRQSHAVPLKWAEIVYSNLDFTYKKVSDVRGPLSHIFAVFDPMTRMRSQTFSSAVFDSVLEHYHDLLIDGLQNLLDTAKTKLRLVGMSEAMITQVEAAAKASGEAIYKELLALSA